MTAVALDQSGEYDPETAADIVNWLQTLAGTPRR
jgi:hypothetical protein